MIKRNYSDILKKELQTKEIIALVGARQVGKTTLLEEIYNNFTKKKTFISFDDIYILQQFENNIKLFEEEQVIPNDLIIIDEIQYSKKSGQFLKYLYDKYKDTKKFFISGSSHPEIAIHSLKYLVGRVRIIEINQISFEEFVEYKSKTSSITLSKKRSINELKSLNILFEEYLNYGGFPQVITLQTIQEKQQKLQELTEIYILKEIKEVLQYRDIFSFSNVMKRLALSDSGLINKSSISAELEITSNQINEIITVLEQTYLISQLRPYLANKIKELIKSSKLYFQDLGIKNSLINNFNGLQLRQDKGAILENFTFNQLRQLNLKPNFWNFKNSFEMDFVLEKNQEIIGIECKSQINNSNLSRSIKEFIKKMKPKQIIILNLSVDDDFEFENTKIIFTHYLNLDKILKN